MTSEVVMDSSGFWYDDGAPVTAMDVLDALRQYRAAEAAAQQRARTSIGVGENGMLALRFLIRAARDGQTVNAKQLADTLGITPASTSALVERLVRSGHVVRRTDPSDRRGVMLTATGSAVRDMLDAVESMEQRTLDAAEHMPQGAAAAFVEFMADMTRALEGDSDDIEEPERAREDSASRAAFAQRRASSDLEREYGPQGDQDAQIGQRSSN